MNDTAQSLMQDLVQSPKTAAIVSGTTTATGISTYLSWLPTNIGWIASLAGFLLSCVLIYTILRRDQREAEVERRDEELHQAELDSIGKRRSI